MFALIRVSGKQYRVENGSQLLVDRLAVEEGQAFEGAEVLLVSDGDNVQIGTPVVSGATIDATVVRHTKGKKIRVFKYKAKKNYRRRIGSRPHQTLLRINSISA
jgi:large subunit ribosomal protein L21